jgi:hypothetical protein
MEQEKLHSNPIAFIYTTSFDLLLLLLPNNKYYYYYRDRTTTNNNNNIKQLPAIGIPFLSLFNLP